MARPRSLALALLAAGCVAGPPRGERVPAPGTFDQVVALVESRFYDIGRLDDAWAASVRRQRQRWDRAATPEERTRALRDLLAGLGASHTGFYVPGEPAWYELMDLYREGPTADAVRRLFRGGVVTYETLGLVLTEIEGESFVADVLDGAPAAGVVSVGDRLVAVADLELPAPGRGTGPRPRSLRVLVAGSDRPGDERVVDLEPVRIEPEELYLQAQRASARVVERDGRRVAYAHLRSWASPRFQELLEEQLLEGELAGADALVLDLRGGWGGANPDYVSLFDPRVPVIAMTQRGERTQSRPATWTKPVVLLVDGTTRSGKEVVAHAFRRSAIGPVVGERTAGAVLGGRPFVLGDGTLLMLAVADVEVDGERLEGLGVEPDVRVPRELRYCAGADPQLEAALDEAARLAAAGR